jgi:hypothetical protein
MNDHLQYLIDTILRDDENEFRAALDQWKSDFSEIVIDANNQSLVHFLADRGSLRLLEIIVDNYTFRTPNNPQEVNKFGLQRWINAKDSKGNSAAVYATVNGHLVYLQGGSEISQKHPS